MLRIKNNSTEKQLVHTVSGVMTVYPDTEEEFDLTPSGLKDAKANAALTLTTNGPNAPADVKASKPKA